MFTNFGSRPCPLFKRSGERKIWLHIHKSEKLVLCVKVFLGRCEWNISEKFFLGAWSCFPIELAWEHFPPASLWTYRLFGCRLMSNIPSHSYDRKTLKLS
jgi:hypothetical protein